MRYTRGNLPHEATYKVIKISLHRAGSSWTDLTIRYDNGLLTISKTSTSGALSNKLLQQFLIFNFKQVYLLEFAEHRGSFSS